MVVRSPAGLPTGVYWAGLRLGSRGAIAWLSDAGVVVHYAALDPLAALVGAIQKWRKAHDAEEVFKALGEPFFCREFAVIIAR